MKRLVCALGCLLVLTSGAMAQDDAPSMRQCLNYFVNFAKDSTVMLAQARDSLAQEDKAEAAPRTDGCLFYDELIDRLERLQLLTTNLTDLYTLYNKTTYCYAKEEKDYLYGRFDGIQTELARLADAPFRVGTEAGDKAPWHEKQFVFTERIARLRAFITASLSVFRR